MKTIKLTKMQGCGNDFVIIDYPEFEKTGLKMSELAKKVCDRNFGVGADGMIIPNLSPENKVNMGKPILEDKKIPFWSENGEKKLVALDREFEITPVSMGNPHCVIITDDDPMELAKKYGPTIEKHEFFPEKTNTEFVKVKSNMEIDMRVYERGCGITLACGTGACASVVACVLNNLTENKVKVNLLGGPVFVEWQGSKDDTEKDIFLIGSANYSFFAEYML